MPWAFLLSYFIGAFPQVYLLGRLKGVDLRKVPDLHLALYRQVSRPLAILGIATDIAKGPAAVFIAYLLNMPLWAVALCGFFALVGQMWPVLLPGTGGRGNSTGFGLSFALSYQTAIWCSIPVLAGFFLRTIHRLLKSREITAPHPGTAVLMLTYFALLPALSFYRKEELPITLAFLGVFVLIILRRLTVGLKAELKNPRQKSWGRILLNRFLYDRS